MKQTPTFLSLQQYWYDRLKREHGFVDIENKSGRFTKAFRYHTNSFKTREIIREFFVMLDHFLTEHPDIPAYHFEVLRRYSDGETIASIAKTSNRTKVKIIISHYKKVMRFGL